MRLGDRSAVKSTAMSSNATPAPLAATPVKCGAPVSTTERSARVQCESGPRLSHCNSMARRREVEMFAKALTHPAGGLRAQGCETLEAGDHAGAAAAGNRPCPGWRGPAVLYLALWRLWAERHSSLARQYFINRTARQKRCRLSSSRFNVPSVVPKQARRSRPGGAYATVTASRCWSA